MGSKVIRNITKVFKSASGVLFGRATAGTGRGEELTPAQVRNLLSVYTISQTDTAISTAVNNLVAGAPGLLDTLDELSAALGDDANFASTVTTALAGKVDSSTLNESIDDRVAALLVAGTNISVSYNDATNQLTITNTAAGLSGTGSVDNAVLRADGTGGATLQSSAIVIDDLYTASPNNTVNFVCLKPTGGTLNVGVAVVPQGTAPFTLAVPDGTTTGGNARGTNAIDLQTVRGAANQVASGTYAVILGGSNNRVANGHGYAGVVVGSSNTVTGANAVIVAGNACTASGVYSAIVNGNTNVASAESSFIGGGIYNTASGTNSVIGGGAANTASATYASILGGATAVANRYGMRAFSAGSFASNGDVQNVNFILRRKTTDATPTTLMLDGSSTRLTIPAGKILFVDVLVAGIKSDGSAAACYKRKVAIKNVSGTTSLVGTVETIGTDIEDSPGVNDVTITADDTNDALDISVTAEATWRWLAVVEGLEIAYGT